MEVHVSFTTQLKAVLGADQQTVSLSPGASVGDALKTLATEHAAAFEQLVMRGDSLLPSILLCVNDQQATIDSALADGDRLTLLSAISGG